MWHISSRYGTAVRDTLLKAFGSADSARQRPIKMHFTFVTLIFQLFAALVLADEDTRPGSEQVLYSLDNDPAGNYLLSFLISNKNGTLSSGVRTSTGGYGLALLNVSPPDSVHVAGNVMNTISFILLWFSESGH
jgi:hypothetical protein